MFLQKLFESKDVVHKALDVAWKKNEAISNNIANVDTPGYKREDVNFEEFLQSAKNKTVQNFKVRTVKDYNTTSMREDGNNVDIDKEMAELAKNQIMYNALAQMSSYSSIRIAIREGK